jgi:hypothetical protein
MASRDVCIGQLVNHNNASRDWQLTIQDQRATVVATGFAHHDPTILQPLLVDCIHIHRGDRVRKLEHGLPYS